MALICTIPVKAHLIISVTNDLSNDQRVHRIATTLVEAGHTVTVVGRKRKASLPLVEQVYQTHRLKLWFETGKLFYLEFAIRLWGWLLWKKVDVLWANDMDTLLPNRLAGWLRRKPVIYDSHEYWTEVPELVSRPGTRRIWLWLERRLFPKVNAAATVNDSIARIYQETYGLEVASIRNLPFHTGELPVRTDPGNILLYQGALNEGRGIELMIQAMEFLPEYHLRIVGYGAVERQLHQLAEGLAWKERVEFTGLIPFDRLAPVTRTAALGLSLEEDKGASYRLALPNKVFDYIQAGIPVLASELPEMAAVVRHYTVGEVLPVEERSPQALAARIRGMVEDNARWQSYREACREAREDLCWEREQDKVLALLGQVFPKK